MNIQVFGQYELEKHIRNGGFIHTHLRFYDVEKKHHLGPKQFIKRIPKKKDIQRIIRYYEKTRSEASGYTIHCWRGISRSTASAFGLFYMHYRDEKIAADKLLEIRKEALPNKLMIHFFDEILAGNLSEQNEIFYLNRIEEWKEELGLLEYMHDRCNMR